MAFPFEYKLCLSDVIVPLSSRLEDLVDLDGLAGGDEIAVAFKFLSISASADMTWCTKALGLKADEWRTNHKLLALVREIREAVETLKNEVKGARKPKRPRCVVPLQIRGRVILAQHHALNLSLAFKPGEEREVLTWFMEEVRKDYEALKNRDPVLDLNPAQETEDEDQQEPWHQTKEKEIIQNILQKLKNHENCNLAIWCSSRCSFKVTTVTKQVRSFYVSKLKKRRVEAAYYDSPEPAATAQLKQQFDSAAQEALIVLETPAGPAELVPLADDM